MARMLVIFLPFLGIMVTLGLVMENGLRRQGFRARRKPPPTWPRHSFDPDSSVKYRGGSRVGWWNMTAPLVPLRADEAWVHLDGFVPVWIERLAVTGVRAIRGFPRWGVRFDTVDGRYDGVIFWTSDSAGVLAALGRLGWPVVG